MTLNWNGLMRKQNYRMSITNLEEKEHNCGCRKWGQIFVFESRRYWITFSFSCDIYTREEEINDYKTEGIIAVVKFWTHWDHGMLQWTLILSPKLSLPPAHCRETLEFVCSCPCLPVEDGPLRWSEANRRRPLTIFMVIVFGSPGLTTWHFSENVDSRVTYPSQS